MRENCRGTFGFETDEREEGRDPDLDPGVDPFGPAPDNRRSVTHLVTEPPPVLSEFVLKGTNGLRARGCCATEGERLTILVEEIDFAARRERARGDSRDNGEYEWIDE